MRNLSDVATGIVDAGPLAVELVNLLRHSEEPVVICAAGILSNLTGTNKHCNNRHPTGSGNAFNNTYLFTYLLLLFIAGYP